MKVNLVCPMFILDSKKNENIRKNDIKLLKILTDKNNEIPKLEYTGGDLKETIRDYLSNIIGTKLFHLQQAFTLEYDNEINIIYTAVTNIENIKKKDENYNLVDFSIENNDTIIFDNTSYKYKTKEKIENNNIEYFHEIKVEDKTIKNMLLEILICYKQIRNSIDNTDIMFKFLPKTFTLEDVRLVYELIKDTTVDKSNFRKKIIKYCEKTSEQTIEKTGFRPSEKYSFKPLEGDIWL